MVETEQLLEALFSKERPSAGTLELGCLEVRLPMSTNDTATQDDCEVVETDDEWSGPHLEYDKYGNLTGAEYYRCRDCGREVLEGIDKDNVSHRDGCRFGGN